MKWMTAKLVINMMKPVIKLSKWIYKDILKDINTTFYNKQFKEALRISENVMYTNYNQQDRKIY